MTPHDNDLGSALDALLANLDKELAKPHRYVAASQIQAAPAINRLGAHAMRRETQPIKIKSSDFRAAIYDQFKCSPQLATYIRVSQVCIYELAQIASHGVNAGLISYLYLTLRAIIERISRCQKLANDIRFLKDKTNSEADATQEIIKNSGIITKALYGTRRNWVEVLNRDLKSASKTDLEYVPNNETLDISAIQILNCVDALDKVIPGTRNVYEILCEYSHPNVGDLRSATLDVTSWNDDSGTRFISRTIGLGKKVFERNFDEITIRDKTHEVCVNIINYFPDICAELNLIHSTISRIMTESAHRVYWAQKNYFKNNDLCPCLSLLRVKDCAQKSEPPKKRYAIRM